MSQNDSSKIVSSSTHTNKCADYNHKTESQFKQKLQHGNEKKPEAKQESHLTNKADDGDSKIASQIAVLENRLQEQKNVYSRVNLSALPDKGDRIRQKIEMLEEKISKLNLEGSCLPEQTLPPASTFTEDAARENKPEVTQESVTNKADNGDSEIAYRIFVLENQLQEQKKVYSSINLSALPDKGDRIRQKIEMLEEKISKLNLERSCLTQDNTLNTQMPEGNHSNERLPRAETKPLIKPPRLGFTSNQPRLKLTEAEPLPFHSKTETKCPPLQHVAAQAYLNDKSLAEDLIKKALTDLHDSLEDAPAPDNQAEDPADLASELKPHQRHALSWMLWREKKHPKGGILADDMGMGKTVTMIALMLGHRSSRISNSKTKAHCIKIPATLVVCPASLIHQWASEIKKHCKKNALKVLIYHEDRKNIHVERLNEYNVVITTYNIISKEINPSESDIYLNEQQSPLLLQVRWYRVILDEAHTIKNPKSKTAKCVCTLKSKYRWAVTGTPIHNDLNDMYSIIKFLHFTPFNEIFVWKEWVKQEKGTERLNVLVKSILLRRTKYDKDASGKPLIQLPNKTAIEHKLTLSEKERNVYDKLLSTTMSTLNNYISNKENKTGERVGKIGSSKLNSLQGTRALSTHATGSLMLVLILRLQQCCSHLSLLHKPKVENITDPPPSLQEDDLVEMMSDLTLTNLEDRTISTESVDDLQKKADLSFLGLDEFKEDREFSKSAISTKLGYLLKELEVIRNNSKENKEKCVVVSQWTSMLDIVAYHLKQLGFKFDTIQGTIKPEERTKIVHDFNTNPDGAEVLLLSLRAGGVGLNLIGGNHLFLMDWHWNPALEQQATDRVYRIGQEKNVYIHRFICENTIEQKIQEMQQYKQNLAVDVLEGASQKQTKLTLKDLCLLFDV